MSVITMITMPEILKEEALSYTSRLAESTRVLVWGAGFHGRWLMEQLGNKGIGFVDSNPTKHGTVIHNKKIYSPDILSTIDFDIILISVLSDPESIAKYLQNKGFEEEKHFHSVFQNGKLYQFISRIDEFVSFLDGLEISNKEILEVGSGGQLFLAILMIFLGAKKITVTDVVEYPVNIVIKYRAQYEKLFHFLESHFSHLKHNAIAFDTIFDCIEFIMEPISASELPFDNDSFDCVYSTGVLEHLNDVNGTISEAKRVLRTDGYFIAFAVGIHDHRANDPKSKCTPWSFLQYSDEEWNRFTSNAYHQNRFRAVDFKRLLQAHSIDIVKYRTDLNETLEKDDISRFNKRFIAYSYHELIEMNLFLAGKAKSKLLENRV